jgi:hypothetical protein
MRKALLVTTGLAWLALTGSAYAAITLTPGPMDPLYFASEAAGQNGFTLDGVTWTDTSGAAATAKGSIGGVTAAPFGMGTSTTTGTTYMSVKGGGTETATFSKPQTSLSIYWGSIDGDVPGSPSNNNLNSVITVGGFTLTGAELIGMGSPPVLGKGGHFSPGDNQLVTINGLADFTSVQFHSKANAFEFSFVPSSAVPESSTWAMMALGFAGLGYAAFRRNSKGRAVAI